MNIRPFSHEWETLGAARVYFKCFFFPKLIGKTRPYNPYMLMCSIIKGNRYYLTSANLLEGRLSMNTIERKPEGFKEKRAELTFQKVHYLEADRNFIPAEPASTPAKTTPAYSGPDYSSPSATATASPPKVATVPQVHDDEPIPPVTTPQFPSQPMPVSEPDVDDIPF
ncbi:hypothetical protein MiSe_12810 [Microseira wollei NIES-4236]|uniref:Uncharacterized protein n=2 Tax=Microseira wollei TaxID=467598 RepID=A0AAV3X406_9CYAN|nr:hypothetical protein MiSe_12810 [Microseira wollei NIES-4236]